MSFWENVNPIIDGEAVKSATPNRPIEQLTNRTQWLFDQLQKAEAGSSLILRSVPVNADVEVGHVVYFNEDVGAGQFRYDRAIAEVNGSNADGQWFASKRAFGEGLVLEIFNGASNTADILIAGALDLTSYLDNAGKTLDDLFDDGSAGTGGIVYLSSQDEGLLSFSRSVTSSYVGTLRPDGVISFKAGVIGSNRDHTHYLHMLWSAPAGDTSDPGSPNPHVITNPDTSLRGWLPVSEFDPSAVPAGAVFGYNINHPDDVELKNNFPPVPLDLYYAERNGVGISGEVIQVTEDGIWWMTDAYGNVPWPTDYDSSAPDLGDTEIKFWITKISLVNGIGKVISLAPDTNSSDRIPVEVFIPTEDSDNLNPQAGAKSGILTAATAKIGYGTEEVYNTNTQASINDSTAAQRVSGANLIKVPVLSRLVSGSGISLVSSHGNNAEGHYGHVMISLAGDLGTTGKASLVVLNSAREDVTSGIHFVALPSGRSSSVRYKVTAGPVAFNNTLNVKFNIFSTIAGTIPALDITYRVIPPASLTGNTAVPMVDTPGISTGAITVDVNSIRATELNSGITGVAPGSVVFLEISRTASDGYLGNVNILDVIYEYS